MGAGRYRNPMIRLLEDDEERSKPENRRKTANLMRALDRKIREEQESTKALGSCPKCHLVLTTQRKCPLGHII